MCCNRFDGAMPKPVSFRVDSSGSLPKRTHAHRRDLATLKQVVPAAATTAHDYPPGHTQRHAARAAENPFVGEYPLT